MQSLKSSAKTREKNSKVYLQNVINKKMMRICSFFSIIKIAIEKKNRFHDFCSSMLVQMTFQHKAITVFDLHFPLFIEMMSAVLSGVSYAQLSSFISVGV